MKFDPLIPNPPLNWQTIPWESFPVSITLDDTVWNPEKLSTALGHPDEVSLDYDANTLRTLIDRFNWDYLNNEALYIGKPISLGLFYGYPKCCIYQFSFADRFEQTAARGNHGPNGSIGIDGLWVLCDDCYDYARQQGRDDYINHYAKKLLQRDYD